MLTNSVEASQKNGPVNKMSLSNTPPTESLNAITDVEDPGVKVRNEQNNQDTSFDSSDKNDDSSQESLLELPANPSSLKAQCIQKMIEQAVNNCPPTLLMICLDSLLWNENKCHPCGMQLPRTLATQTLVAELVNYSAPTDQLNISGNEEVLLYGNIRVNRKVWDCWLANLKKRSYVVKLPKLMDADIKLWQPVDESWKQIDPYLDLEDIGDTDINSTNQTSETVVSHFKSNYTLRTRKSKDPVGSVQPNRKAKLSVKYKDFYSDLDLGISPKPKVKSSKWIKPSTGPLQSQIDAQRWKTEEPKVKLPVPVPKTPAPEPSTKDTANGVP